MRVNERVGFGVRLFLKKYVVFKLRKQTKTSVPCKELARLEFEIE